MYNQDRKYIKTKNAEQLDIRTFSEKGIITKNSPSYNKRNNIKSKKLIL
jgi:hypothetical protein